MSESKHYGLIATYNNIVLDVIIDQFGEVEARKWVESLTDEELAKLNQDPSFHLRKKQVVNDSGSYFGAFVYPGRSFGKAQLNETPILTSRGYKTFGTISVGDQVFDHKGQPVNVIGVHPQGEVEEYKVKFTDGSVMMLSGDHLLTTINFEQSYKLSKTSYTRKIGPDWATKILDDGSSLSSTKTVKELSSELKVKRGNQYYNNLRIPLTSPVNLPESDRVLDDYLFGYWLGDGTRGDGQITVHKDELERLLRYCEGLGYEIGKLQPHKKSNAVSFKCLGLRKVLLDNGLDQKDKLEHLLGFGSIEQRLSLLQGLMDSDGTASKLGHVEFSSKDEHISRLVHWLACSLGEMPRFYRHEAKLYGKKCADRLRVHWTPINFIPFRLDRKMSRVKLERDSYSNTRVIESIEYIGTSFDYTCISIDSLEMLYLSGHELMPSHNSFMGSCFITRRALTGYNNIAIIGQTSNDVIHKQVMTGPSSIIELYKDTEFCPTYIKQDRKLTWPNGMQAQTFAGDEYDQVRGLSGSTAWSDETAKYRYGKEFVSNLEMGIRESQNPFVLITTTPQPKDFIKDLFNDDSYYKVTGSTLENTSRPEKFINKIKKMDFSNPFVRQEILGEIAWESEGALWKRSYIDPYRARVPELSQMENIIIGLDPTTGTGKKNQDDAGIIVAGSVKVDREDHGYILEDLTVKGDVSVWAKATYEALQKYPNARVVAESNAGGQMIVEVLTNYGVPKYLIELKHHIKSKYERAKPLSLLASQGQIHHCGNFPDLENEMCSYEGKSNEKSPNRLDAAVIALHALLVKTKGAFYLGTM